MTRPRGKHIKVYGTKEELFQIEQLSKSANLSQSKYLLTAGLNKPIRSIFDVHAVTELSKVNGELGRIAELLSEKREGAHVEAMIKELRALQTESHRIMGKLTR